MLNIEIPVFAHKKPPRSKLMIAGIGVGFGDPEGAGDWLGSLAPGHDRDSAIAAYITAIDGSDIAAANLWATKIDDPAERLEVTRNAFARWMGERPSDAAAWLEAAALEPGLHEALNGIRARADARP